MYTKREFVGVGVRTAITLGLVFMFGFAALPAFAQTDDYGTGSTSGTYCPQLSQTVVRGSSGNQVLELQKFLSDYYDIPPATIQTGYFGRITQGYVIQFQKEQGLPSYGIAGSMTRAAISKVCGGSTIQSSTSTSVGGQLVILPPGIHSAYVDFSKSPTSASGDAPLEVSFSAYIGDADANTFYVEFGDGQSGAIQSGGCTGGSGPCWLPHVNHTYASAGTYTAKLKRNVPFQGDNLGIATITVSGQAQNKSDAIFEAFPSGSVGLPLDVHFRAMNLDPLISYTVDFGDGQRASMRYTPNGPQGQYENWSVDHTYAAYGTYTAKLLNGSTVIKTVTPTVVVTNPATTVVPSTTSTTQSGGSYTMPTGIHSVGVNFTSSQTSVSGSAPLDVNFWSSSFQLDSTYTVDFGDGQSGAIQPGGCGPTSTSVCSAPHVSHKYNSVGTYTANLIQKSSCPFVGDGPCYQNQTPYQRTVGTAQIIVGS